MAPADGQVDGEEIMMEVIGETEVEAEEEGGFLSLFSGSWEKEMYTTLNVYQCIPLSNSLSLSQSLSLNFPKTR